MKRALMAIAALCALCAGAFAQDDIIRVQFVDSATKTIFAVAQMPAGKLPAKFDASTMLNIKGEKWVVLSADPPAKTDFLKTGRLTLVLAKADKMYPGGGLSSLFSIPSVSGGIPRAAGGAPPGDTIFSVHENDWRQVEFVSLGYEKEIDAEFADIRNVGHKPGGYTDLFVRERIEEPVRHCTLRDVQELIPQVKNFQAVGFVREPGTIPRSFAWAVDGTLVIWGLTDGQGDVTELCLSGAPQKEHIATISAAFSKLTLRYDLYLVDWCRTARVRGDIRDFEKYFEGL